MKALIFGVSGQDGFYLTQLLLSKQIEVIGVSRSTGNWIQGNVADYQFVSNIIKAHQPDFIFHLAANSTTKHEALFENHETISTGAINILESVRLYSPSSKVFLSGSAMQFKNEGVPINENTLLEGSSPYAVARIQSLYASRYFRKEFGVQVYFGYLFNHDSPIRSENHVNQKIVRATQRIVNGSNERIKLGDIKVRKEFNFAGDTVAAIWVLVNQSNIFEVVIGCGRAYSIEEWLVSCFRQFNKDYRLFVDANVEILPRYEVLVSDPKLLISLGWKPKHDFNSLLKLMIEN